MASGSQMYFIWGTCFSKWANILKFGYLTWNPDFGFFWRTGKRKTLGHPFPRGKSQLELSGDRPLETGLHPSIFQRRCYSLAFPNNRHWVSSMYRHHCTDVLLVAEIYFSVPTSVKGRTMEFSAGVVWAEINISLWKSKQIFYLSSLFIHLCCLTPSGIWVFDPWYGRENTHKEAWDLSSVLAQGLIVDKTISNHLSKMFNNLILQITNCV